MMIRRVSSDTGPTPPALDTRSIGRVPNLSVDHREWADWSFRFPAFMGAANEGAVELLRWAAAQTEDIEEATITAQDTPRSRCRKSCTWRSRCSANAWRRLWWTKMWGYIGLGAWRILQSHYDPDSRGRQRMRVSIMLQPTKPAKFGDLRGCFEKWERDARDYKTRFSKVMDEDVKIGVVLDLAPDIVHRYCHLGARELKTRRAGATTLTAGARSAKARRRASARTARTPTARII